METVAPSQELSVIDKSLPILSKTNEILITHESRIQKAQIVVGGILNAIAANDGKLNADLDVRIQNFLAGCNKAKRELEDSRKPLTQTMDLIRKQFTTLEGKIDVASKDSLVYVLQQHRNQYAKDLVLEEQRKQKEAEEKAAKGKEAISIRSEIKNGITQCFLDFLAVKKTAINGSFNNITLDNYEEKSGRLKVLNISFPLDKIPELIGKCAKPSYFKHTDDEAQVIINEEIKAFDSVGFINQYETHLRELKQSLIDKLPSKKQELESMAKAGEEEKARLEKLKAEREAAEQKRLDEEAYLSKRKAEEEAESQKLAGETQVLFDTAMSVTDGVAAPETRQRFDIVVSHPAGWYEIFALWMQHEGARCTPDELEKMTFKKMKTFAEDKAYKDDVKINSKYIRYDLSVKAVNRKAK